MRTRLPTPFSALLTLQFAGAGCMLSPFISDTDRALHEAGLDSDDPPGGADSNSEPDTDLPTDTDDAGPAVDTDEPDVETLDCYFDEDCDGFAHDSAARVAVPNTAGATTCTAIAAGSTCYADGTGDCDDSKKAVNPAATEEVGDGVDQDCDGKERCYLDADDDGYRTDLLAPETPADGDCSDEAEAFASEPSGDCNDEKKFINPGASEVESDGAILCDGVDQDCDPFTKCSQDNDMADTAISSIAGPGYGFAVATGYFQPATPAMVLSKQDLTSFTAPQAILVLSYSVFSDTFVASFEGASHAFQLSQNPDQPGLCTLEPSDEGPTVEVRTAPASSRRIAAHPVAGISEPVLRFRSPITCLLGADYASTAVGVESAVASTPTVPRLEVRRTPFGSGSTEIRRVDPPTGLVDANTTAFAGAAAFGHEPAGRSLYVGMPAFAEDTSYVFRFADPSSTTSGTPVVQMEGDFLGFGRRMLTCDIDQDGRDELLVSADGTPGVFLFDTTEDGFGHGKTWLIEYGFDESTTVADQQGFACGDFDGDGLRDVAIGDALQGDFGAVRIYLTPADWDDFSIAPRPPDFFHFYLLGTPTTADIGHALAALPDVNGDGRDELIIGAPSVTKSGGPDSYGGYLIWYGQNAQ